MQKNYMIIESVKGKLDEKIKKLNRKILRNNLNITPISYTVDREFFGENVNGIINKMLDITLNYDVIQIEGYSVIAQLNHEYDNGNIIRMVDTTKTIDKMYYNIGCNCEHCGVNRERKTTYIIQDVKGNLKQIGKNCLNNYIGINVDNYVAYLESIEDIDDVIVNLNSGGSDEFYIETEKYLEVVNQVIDEVGYISKSRAIEMSYDSGELVQSTCIIAYHIYMDVTRSHRQNDIEISNNVIDAIGWIKGVDTSKSEYLNNLQVLSQNKYIKFKDLGYVSSLLATYYKAVTRESDRTTKDNQAKESNYILEVGEKAVLTVVVDRIINYDTQYGVNHIHLMHDAEGNVIVYRGTKFLLENINDTGSEITIKCTIKEHLEYNGVKQTIVQRPKLV